MAPEAVPAGYPEFLAQNPRPKFRIFQHSVELTARGVAEDMT
jgi:hypothetical protein